MIKLRQAGVFAKLFNRKKLKAEIVAGEEKIKEYEEEKNSTTERVSEMEFEQDRLRRELSQFESELRRVGLRLEDIEDEYYQIKHDFQQKEQGVKLKVVPGQGKTQRPSQTEKFNTRLAKREAMLAGKEPKPEQEAQSE